YTVLLRLPGLFLLHRAVLNPLFCSDDASPELYALSLHDALPILSAAIFFPMVRFQFKECCMSEDTIFGKISRGELPATIVYEDRSEEHTSELQSRENLVCRLLLEKKKQQLYHEASPDTRDERREL